MEAKLTETQTAKQALEQRAATAEASLKSQSESLAAASGKLKGLESELAAAQNQVKDLMDKNHLQQQQDLIPNLNQQIATLRDQVAQLETASSLTEKTATEAAAAAKTLQAEKEALQQALNASQTTVSDLQKQLEQAKPQPAAQAQPAAEAPTATTPAIADHDKDGVADAVDLCASSPAGSPVNALGCPAGKGIVLAGVNFKSGTAVLSPESLKKLDAVATALTQAPQLRIEVAGYTDAGGDPKLNLDLSAQRAQAVAKYLSGKGVTSTLAAKGYGKENPLADNATAAGKQKNRRVELHLSAP